MKMSASIIFFYQIVKIQLIQVIRLCKITDLSYKLIKFYKAAKLLYKVIKSYNVIDDKSLDAKL